MPNGRGLITVARRWDCHSRHCNEFFMFVIDKRQLRVGIRYLQYRRYLVSISMTGNLIEMLTKFIYNESKLFKIFHELNSRGEMDDLINWLFAI